MALIFQIQNAPHTHSQNGLGNHWACFTQVFFCQIQQDENVLYTNTEDTINVEQAFNHIIEDHISCICFFWHWMTLAPTPVIITIGLSLKWFHMEAINCLYYKPLWNFELHNALFPVQKLYLSLIEPSYFHPLNHTYLNNTCDWVHFTGEWQDISVNCFQLIIIIWTHVKGFFLHHLVPAEANSQPISSTHPKTALSNLQHFLIIANL